MVALFVEAASSSCIDVADWLHPRVPLTNKELFKAVASVCTAKDWTAEGIYGAAYHRRPVRLQFLESVCGFSFETATPQTNECIFLAAFNQQLPVLQWLRTKGCWTFDSKLSEDPDGEQCDGHDVLVDTCMGFRVFRHHCYFDTSERFVPVIRCYKKDSRTSGFADN